MRIERTIDATPEAVFSLISKSLVADMTQSGAAPDESAPAAGDCYTKTLRTKLGASRQVTVRIEALEAPSLYEASFTSSDGVTRLRYELTPAAQGTQVAYEETFEAPTTLGSLNQKLMQRLLSRSSKQRMNAMLDALESQLARS